MSVLNLPSKPYDEVESQFIKERISERQFELESHRKYIQNLIFLERVILDEISLKYGSGMKYESVKKEHFEEYMEILKELDQEKYEEKQEKLQKQQPSYVHTSNDKEKIREARKKWEQVNT